MINCFTLGHFSSHILSNTFTFQVRALREEPTRSDDLIVTNWINKPFDVVEAVSVKVLPSMALTFKSIHIQFVRDVVIYGVYHFTNGNVNESIKVGDVLEHFYREEAIHIPAWFPKLAFCKKDTILHLDYDRIPKQDDYVQINKFNFLEQL